MQSLSKSSRKTRSCGAQDCLWRRRPGDAVGLARTLTRSETMPLRMADERPRVVGKLKMTLWTRGDTETELTARGRWW